MAIEAYPLPFEPTVDEQTVLRSELHGIMRPSDLATRRAGEDIAFTGKLIADPGTAYPTLKERFRPYGYTPLLRRDGRQDVVVASPGLIQAWTDSRPWIQFVLLLATIVTTTFSGMAFSAVNVPQAVRIWRASGDALPLIEAFVAGLAFSIPLLLILGVHELGHYFVGRWHGVHVTLPYFIPVPIGLGTFGAFIQMKSPAETRRALFDVGVAGPIAGFVVALPLFVLGLMLSSVGAPARGGAIMLGKSWLVEVLIDWLLPHAHGQVVYLHPIAIAAWFGLLVTGFNLLPIGQLDGGHVVYSLLGRWAAPLGVVVFLGMLALGYLYWPGWYLWAFFALITGIKHPAPLDDITPLDFRRVLVALFSLAIFLALLSLRPF